MIALIWTAINVYALSMAGYLALHALTGTRYWPVELLANFAHWLLLPMFVILPVALWRGRSAQRHSEQEPSRQRYRLAAVLSAIGVLGFVIHYGVLFLPEMSTARAVGDDALPLTVMTYNVQHRKVSPEELVEIVEAVDAEIVSVIELGWHQSGALEKTDYPYQLLYGDGSGRGAGMGLLSRYPILEHERFFLGRGRRPHIRAVLDVDGTPLTVIMAHPSSPRLRDFQYRPNPTAASEIAALAELAASEGPSILLGDLNTSDQSDAYRSVVDAGLIDSFRTVGWGFGATWPTPRLFEAIQLPAFVRIDYIFHTPELQAESVWVETAAVSDHLPVVAHLRWDRSGD